jgi:hypothetical protein
MSVEVSLMTTDPIEQLAERGQTIYDQKLKATLEPDQNGRVVAIHVDTEEYGLGRNSHEAVRAVRVLHPEGRLVILTIGSQPDYALAARLMAGEMMARPAK